MYLTHDNLLDPADLVAPTRPPRPGRFACHLIEVEGPHYRTAHWVGRIEKTVKCVLVELNVDVEKPKPVTSHRDLKEPLAYEVAVLWDVGALCLKYRSNPTFTEDKVLDTEH